MMGRKPFENTARQVRASLYARCRICIKACPKRAVRIDGHIKIDAKRCDRCGRCTKGCVVARYYGSAGLETKKYIPQIAPYVESAYSKDLKVRDIY